MKMQLLFWGFLMFLSARLLAQSDPAESPDLVEVAQFGRYQCVGLAVSAKRPIRIFVTFPQREPYEYGLAELENGQRKSYPNREWNRPIPDGNVKELYDPLNHLINVQALWVDNTNTLWVLDPANAPDRPQMPAGVKLLKINLGTNQVERIYRFEDLPRERTALNDVRVDTRRQVAYLSDPGRSALVVLDLKTGKSRTVLENLPATKADPNFPLRIDGKDVRDQTGRPFSSNVNGIALTDDFRYLYFRPINQTKLYRIETQYLLDQALTPTQLAARITTIDNVGVSHGMIADAQGNVYLTASPDKAIRYVTPAGELRTLIRDPRLLWPDSFAIGPDGYLYVTAAQIHRLPRYNDGQDKVAYPFRLYKVKLPK